MTYDEAMAYWFGRINYETRSATPADLKLERMQRLLELLGMPQDGLRIIHIAGTKGKGSTAAMLEAMLRANGGRVGLFTSPHLVDVLERIQVNRVPISRDEFTPFLAEIAHAAVQLEAELHAAPTFFEISTALAFLHFKRAGCDWVVLEVGLGGRFDSTNVCAPELCLITSIGFDHMAQLGETLPEIAYQKAGIIKPGVPVISGVEDDAAKRVIREVAATQHAPLQELDAEIHVQYHRGRVSVQTPTLVVQDVPLKLLGAHQARNAALAVAACALLQQRGEAITQRAVLSGLTDVMWPARLELLGIQPVLILDFAHNVPSTIALVETLRERFSQVRIKRVVLAISNDKQYPAMMQHLAGYFDEFHLTRYGNNPRSTAPDVLAALLPPGKAVMHHQSADALAAAWANTTEHDLLCVTGSVFLAGELQQAMRALARPATP